MIETITATDAAALMSNPNVLVIDVREQHEWDAGHIAGTRLVPLDQFRADPDAVLSHDATIIFVCAKGVRSLNAAKLAERLGYEKLFNLEGGTIAWAKSGLGLATDQRVAA